MAETTAAPAEKAPKSVDELLAGFALDTPKPVDPIAEAREQREKSVVENVGQFANYLVSVVEGTDDEDSLRGALTSLATVKTRIVKAVRALPDGAFQFGASTPQTTTLPEGVDEGDDPDEA